MCEFHATPTMYSLLHRCSLELTPCELFQYPWRRQRTQTNAPACANCPHIDANAGPALRFGFGVASIAAHRFYLFFSAQLLPNFEVERSIFYRRKRQRRDPQNRGYCVSVRITSVFLTYDTKQGTILSPTKISPAVSLNFRFAQLLSFRTLPVIISVPTYFPLAIRFASLA